LARSKGTWQGGLARSRETEPQKSGELSQGEMADLA
jgi:hypothetical protein